MKITYAHIKYIRNANILLVDVDSKIPNIVLMKLNKYFLNRNCNITFLKLNISGYPKKKKIINIDGNNYNHVFISIIFTVNENIIKVDNCNNVYFGGSGFNCNINLPEIIDNVNYDYLLYPEIDYSLGFITRGCPNKCYFCFVPKKEGRLYYYNYWKDFIKHDKVKFLDNNFLAYEKHYDLLTDFIDNDLKFQFNQGLDIKLINRYNSFLLKKCNLWNELIFAFDDISYLKIIEKQLKFLKDFSDWKLKFFIYSDSGMELKNIVRRIKFCNDNKILPYVMRNLNCWDSKYKNFYIDISAYCNQPNIFKKMNFETFLYERTFNNERINSSLKLWLDNDGYL